MPPVSRRVWKLLHRINRIGARSEEVRGTCMNLAWIERFEQWEEAWENLLAVAVEEGIGVRCDCGQIVPQVEVYGTELDGLCFNCGAACPSPQGASS